MKKILTLFLALAILMLSFCACKNSDVSNDQITNVEETSDIAVSADKYDDTTDSSSGIIVPESLAEKYLREIDEEYRRKFELPEYSTTIGMVELSDEYAKKWEQVADEYYNKIMEYDDVTQLNENYYSSDDLHTFVYNMKVNWESYSQEQCANYLKTLQTIYGAGTIVGPLIAEYEYKMQMDWALQILDICQRFCIE